MRENLNDSEEPQTSAMRITRRVELNFWRTCLLNAAGLSLAWITTPSIQFHNILAFGLLVVLIWFLNWILKPVLVLFALPFIIFTIGVGMLFINAFIIYFAARLIPGDDIIVGSYWAALWASFLVSVLSWGLALARSERITVRTFVQNKKDRGKPDNDDVIDV